MVSPEQYPNNTLQCTREQAWGVFMAAEIFTKNGFPMRVRLLPFKRLNDPNLPGLDRIPAIINLCLVGNESQVSNVIILGTIANQIKESFVVDGLDPETEEGLQTLRSRITQEYFRISIP